TQFFLVILAVTALACVCKSMACKTRAARGIIVGIVLLAALENLAVPVPLMAVPTTARTQWTAWLRLQPAGTVIAHLPFPPGPHVSHYEIESWRMFHQTDHRQPMINGYASYFPPGYGVFQDEMAAHFPTEHLICHLGRTLNVTLLVVDRQWDLDHERDLAIYTTRLRPVYSDDRVR